MAKLNIENFKRFFGRVGLYISTGAFAALFLGRALMSRGRATHTAGVAGRGRLKVSEKPAFPECGFFKPGKKFPVTIRHATALQSDSACKNLRSIAIKFSHNDFESPLDLIMNTGKVAPFWKIPQFFIGVVCAAFKKPGRWVYQHLFPLAKANVIIGSRRDPETFTQMNYYSQIAFDYYAKDGVKRLCRFRVIPHDRGEETGLPDETDIKFPWRDNRRKEATHSPDHLIREYRNSVRDGGTPRYWLQIQTHDRTEEDTNQVYSIAHEWDPKTHPWHDVGEIEIHSVLDANEAENLRFRINHQPDCLGIPEAEHPLDYRAIAWMRKRVYPMDQAWRSFWQRFRKTLRYGRHVQWDRPHVEEWKAFRKSHTNTFLLPLDNEKTTATKKYLESTYKQWYEILPNLDSLHYLRIYHIPIAGTQHLAINLVYDGELRDHLDDLLRIQEGLFARLLVEAGSHGNKPHQHREYLIRHENKTRATYMGGVNNSKVSILEEQNLRIHLQSLLDQHEKSLRDKQCETIRRFLKDHLDKHPLSGLPTTPRPPLSTRAKINKLADLLGSLINPISGLLYKDVFKWASQRKTGPLRWGMYVGLAFWVAYAAIPTGLFLLLIRHLEKKEPARRRLQLNPDWIAKLEDTENQRLQNNLTMYAPVHDSLLRRWVLKIILAGADKGARHIWNEGQLTGIDTIHFARFLTVDKGKWMLFMSDYDGSWNRYLEDFLTVGSRAVVPIWSNLNGCPKTEWLFNPTAGFAGQFMNFTRSRQVPSLLWFSAYPNLSMPNLLSNARLRDGLFKETMNEEEAADWLSELNG